MKRNVSMFATAALALTALLAGCGNTGSAAAAKAAASTLAAVDSTDAASDSAKGGDVGPNVPYVDPMLTPLSRADIDLYLGVMRAAAARVQHPPVGDLDAIRELKAYNARVAATAEANAPAQARFEARQKKLQDDMTAAMQSGDMDKVKALAAEQMKQGQALGQLQSAEQVTPLDDETTTLAMNLSDGQADEVIVRERHLDADRWDRLVSVIEEIYPPPGTALADCGGDCAPQLTPEQVRQQHEHDAGVVRNRKILAPYAQQIHSLEAIVRARKS